MFTSPFFKNAFVLVVVASRDDKKVVREDCVFDLNVFLSEVETIFLLGMSSCSSKSSYVLFESVTLALESERDDGGSSLATLTEALFSGSKEKGSSSENTLLRDSVAPDSPFFVNFNFPHLEIVDVALRLTEPGIFIASSNALKALEDFFAALTYVFPNNDFCAIIIF